MSKPTTKESFLLYKSTYDAIKDLTLEEKGLLLDAIFLYNIEGTVSPLPRILNMAFNFMKSQFDRDNRKYEAICERNRSNIKKRWDTDIPQDTKNTTGINGIPKDTKNTDTDTDTESDTDTDTDTDTELKPENFKNFQDVISFFDSKFFNKDNWLDCYDKLIRIDKYSEDRILEIVREFRSDGNFWKDNGNFESLLKLRNKDRQGIKYIDLFDKQLKSKHGNRNNNKRLATAAELANDRI